MTKNTGLSNIRSTSDLETQRLLREFKKLRMELKQCGAGSQAEQYKLDRIDELLDRRLDQKGAHKPDCGCHECYSHVMRVMSRRLGECVDPRDVAGPGEFGPLG